MEAFLPGIGQVRDNLAVERVKDVGLYNANRELTSTNLCQLLKARTIKRIPTIQKLVKATTQVCIRQGHI
jgi:hypothetical protein